jgi:hypothetical protein
MTKEERRAFKVEGLKCCTKEQYAYLATKYRLKVKTVAAYCQSLRRAEADPEAFDKILTIIQSNRDQMDELKNQVSKLTIDVNCTRDIPR